MKKLVQYIIVIFATLAVTGAFAQGMGGSGGGSFGGSATMSALDVSGPMNPQGSILALTRQSHLLLSQLDQLKVEMGVALDKFKSAQSKVRDGLAPQVDANEAEAELANVRMRMQQVEISYAYVKLLLGLAQPVSVDFNKANIRQVAQVLSKTASIPITVAEGVPNDTIVTTKAEGVPLAGVLEVVANSAGVVIEPDGTGVKLTKPAKMTTNGKVVTFDYTNYPWSDAWSFGGGYGGGGGNIPIGRRWLGLFNANVGEVQPASQQIPRASSAALAPLVLAGVGSSTLVVAEPGVGPQGEPGYWLTQYNLANGGFARGASTFHKSASSKPIPKAAPKPSGGMGGFGGGSGGGAGGK